MALRVQMLAAYDVADNKSRKKLAEQLKDFGLIPIQKSVMWGFLSKAEQTAVMRIFDELLDNNDRAFLIKANLTGQMEYFAGVIPSDITEPKNYDII